MPNRCGCAVYALRWKFFFIPHHLCRQIETLRSSFSVVKDEASNIPTLRQHIAQLQKEAAGAHRCITHHASRITHHASHFTHLTERESFISALLTQRSDSEAQVRT
jgi:hypothetical protein